MIINKWWKNLINFFLYWDKLEKILRWMEIVNFFDYILFIFGEMLLLWKLSLIRFFLMVKIEFDDFWMVKIEFDDLDMSRNNINNGDKV